MHRTVLILLALLLAFPALAEPMVNMKTMTQSCKESGGRWTNLPDWCGNMHPKVFRSLTLRQREYCVNITRSPCTCPKGQVFRITEKAVGCLPDPFLKYQKPKPAPTVDYRKLFQP